MNLSDSIQNHIMTINNEKYGRLDSLAIKMEMFILTTGACYLKSLRSLPLLK
jgi:hypothetical protein